MDTKRVDEHAAFRTALVDNDAAVIDSTEGVRDELLAAHDKDLRRFFPAASGAD